jgi:hypothetical protein
VRRGGWDGTGSTGGARRDRNVAAEAGTGISVSFPRVVAGGGGEGTGLVSLHALACGKSAARVWTHAGYTSLLVS